MRLIRTTRPGPIAHGATALAIGNFDGLHRGHQALMRSVCARADELTPALMCFEPLPATYFRPQQPVQRILNVRDKLLLCRGYGLDLVFMLRFNARFAAQDPQTFVKDVVVGLAAARHVVVGEDFRFGARAAGDVELLSVLGRQHGFTTQVMESVSDDGHRVSSSRIRQAMAQGDLAETRHLLGRAYAVSGRVLRGRALGRKLGYPTLNLRPPEPPALAGIFAVRVSGAGLERHPAVASLGIRPTVAGKDWLLEVHLFDYDGDLYGRHVSVEFIEFLRQEVKFDNLETMTRQMDEDARQARAILLPPGSLKNKN
jgi:riboflavin kinase / FMN adenylyltransferase